MIPFILAILITFFISTLNIEPNAKLMILFIVFILSLIWLNDISFKLLPNKIKVHIVRTDTVIYSKHKIYLVLKKDTIKLNLSDFDVKFVKNRRISGTIISIPMEEKILPKNAWFRLTLPNIWFKKCNKLKYNPGLGKIKAKSKYIKT